MEKNESKAEWSRRSAWIFVIVMGLLTLATLFATLASSPGTLGA